MLPLDEVAGEMEMERDLRCCPPFLYPLTPPLAETRGEGVASDIVRRVKRDSRGEEASDVKGREARGEWLTVGGTRN